jgi:ppGpp synthetase/RelA/SpoT-type nucleotidyltranferase
VSELKLPMSKGALDRLGARLAASEEVDSADLASLAEVITVYQGVLDEVKLRLTRLGYEATTRAKTTGTLIEKLRREGQMKLSRVQDLAGARIIVPNRLAQDDAVAKLRGHFEASGDKCREVDRRMNPSHGYRAVHLVVQVGPAPVEIQIRTDLEDTWAQIVERLGDRWGRGIRYGGPPEDPEAEVRAGSWTASRREAMAALIDLSETIESFEVGRAAMLGLSQLGDTLIRVVGYVAQFQQARDPRRLSELPEDARSTADLLAAGLAALRPGEAAQITADPDSMTFEQLFQAVAAGLKGLKSENEAMLEGVHSAERELRGTLQVIAEATVEGE